MISLKAKYRYRNDIVGMTFEPYTLKRNVQSAGVLLRPANRRH